MVLKEANYHSIRRYTMQATQSRSSTPARATHTRPAAVTTVAVLSVLRGVLGVFVWLGLLAVSNQVASSGNISDSLKGFYGILLWVLPVMIIGSLVFAVGLWM